MNKLVLVAATSLATTALAAAASLLVVPAATAAPLDVSALAFSSELPITGHNDGVWDTSATPATTLVIGGSGASVRINALQDDASVASAAIPFVATPGSYAIADLSGFDFQVGSIDCVMHTGTLDVVEVAYDVNDTPTVYTADFTGSCGFESTQPVHGSIRWHSTHTYAAADVSPRQIDVKTAVGTTAPVQHVTVNNTGTEPVDVSVDDVTGVASGSAADWQVTGCAATTLAVGDSCTLDITFTAGGEGSRDASFHVTTAAAGELLTDGLARLIALQGDGTVVPGPPYVRASGVTQGANTIAWNDGYDGGTAITGYQVYRWIATSAHSLVATTDSPRYVDTHVTPGVTYTYCVRAVNAVGVGACSVDLALKARHDSIVISAAKNGDAVRGLYRTGVIGGFPVPLEVNGYDHGSVAVSRDGVWVAYARSSTVGSGETDIWKRRVDGTGFAVQLTAMTGDEDEPAWSPDGTTIAFSRYNGPSSAVYTIRSGGGPVTLRANGYSDPSFLPDGKRVVATDDASETAPLTVISDTGKTSALGGTAGGFYPSVSPDGKYVAYSVDDENAGWVRLAVISTLGGTARYSTTDDDVYEPSWTPNGLHVLAIDVNAAFPYLSTWTVDLSTHGMYDSDGGNYAVTSAAWADDIQAPITATSALPPVTLAKSVVFKYGAADAHGITSYDVRYRRATSTSGFGGFVSPHGWTATTATSRALTVSRGDEYCFSVRSRDGFGNVGPWSGERCTSVARDDRSLTAKGKSWKRHKSGAYFVGTYTSTKSENASLTAGTVRTFQAYLVAKRCPTCGTVEVIVGNRVLGKVSLKSSKAHAGRAVIALPRSGTLISGKLKIIVTSRKKTVVIDGIAFRRH